MNRGMEATVPLLTSDHAALLVKFSFKSVRYVPTRKLDFKGMREKYTAFVWSIEDW
jgi:hypothetical protein